MLSDGVRIRFSKTGKLKYISHLDLCRTFRSAFKRARIPIWYSQGFNPHPKMVFATTVSVGNESLCELLDIRITEPMEKEDFISRLRGALTDDIKILDAYAPQGKFTDLQYARYEITFEEELPDIDTDKLLCEPMVITKHSKKGEKEEDIAPLIKSVTVDGDKIVGVFSAAQSSFLGPDNFVKGLSAKLGVELFALTSVRVEVLDKDMKPFR